MNEKALHTLEYDKIIEKLVGYADFPDGKGTCRGTAPFCCHE